MIHHSYGLESIFSMRYLDFNKLTNSTFIRFWSNKFANHEFQYLHVRKKVFIPDYFDGRVTGQRYLKGAMKKLV